MGRQVMQGHISHTLKFWTGGLRGRSRIQPRRRKSGSWRRRRARCRALLRDYRGDAPSRFVARSNEPPNQLYDCDRDGER
jgi:hypothetical protein